MTSMYSPRTYWFYLPRFQDNSADRNLIPVSHTASPHKILIAQTAFIGDVILATSLIEKLHYHFPEAQIDFLLRKGNESLLVNHPHLGKVWVWDKKGGKYRNIWRILQSARKEKYDWVINLQRFATAGFFTAFSGAKLTVGFDKNPVSFLFDQRIAHSFEKIHETQRNTSLVAPFTSSEVFKPRLYPSAQDFRMVDALKDAPYLCFAPTSVWFTKQFPKEKWVDFLRQIQFKGNIYLLGAPSDREACQAMIDEAQSAQAQNLAGKLSLLQSAALMQDAVLNFVNDSAPMHLASAMNAPTCAIFCSTIPDFGFGPLSDFSEIVETKETLLCKPCGIHGKKVCPAQHFKCGFGIETIQLQAVLDRALTNYSDKQ